MRNYNLGDGSTIDLEITPSLQSANGKAALRIPDPVFPEIKGTLRPYPDRPLGSTAPTIMSATAEFTLRASRSGYWIGFKQLAMLKGLTDLYAGFKDQDGSITQGGHRSERYVVYRLRVQPGGLAPYRYRPAVL